MFLLREVPSLVNQKIRFSYIAECSAFFLIKKEEEEECSTFSVKYILT